MKVFRVLDRIFEILSPAICLIYGVLVLAFSGFDFVSNNYQLIIGLILVVGGIATICDYIGGHKIRHEFNFDLVFGILNIVFGIMVMTVINQIEIICLVWGIIEILKGAFEIQDLVVILKHKNYLAFISLGCAILDIVFGTLLCIERYEDITIHLIVVGIVFIASAISQILETVIEHKNAKKVEEK